MRRIVTAGPDKSPSDVLHIGGQHSRQSAELNAAMGAAGLDVDVAVNVYLGLARLLAATASGARGNGYRAIIACVDDLGPTELEFFTIASRNRISAPVFVYGEASQGLRIAKAIELGATDQITPSTVDMLFDEEPQGGFDPSEPDESIIEEPFVESVEEEVVGDDNGMADQFSPQMQSDAGQEEVDESVGEPPSSSARVPWLRYGDRPAREAPRRIGPQRGRSASGDVASRVEAHSDTPAPGSNAPLLTKDELRALMDDDISSIAPAERLDDGFEDQPNEGAGA